MAVTSWVLATMAASYIVSLLSKEPQEEVQEMNQYIDNPVHGGSLSHQLDSLELPLDDFVYEPKIK